MVLLCRFLTFSQSPTHRGESGIEMQVVFIKGIAQMGMGASGLTF